MSDGAASAALQLARVTLFPAVLATLVPLAAPSFRYSGEFASHLDPQDARRLAASPDRQVRALVAYLTDDPAALATLAASPLEYYAHHKVSAHPALPLRSLIEMGPPTIDEHPYESLLESRIAAELPTVELVRAARSSGNSRALRHLLQHPELSADAAFSATSDAPAAPDFEFLTGRPDLPLVLGRSAPGAPHSRELFLENFRRVLELAPPDVEWFHAPAGSATRLVHGILTSEDLGAGAEVGPEVVSLVAHRREFRKELLERRDLSTDSIRLVSDLFWSEVRFEAEQRELSVETLMFSGTLPWQDRQWTDGMVVRLLELAKMPACPLDVLERIPLTLRDLSPLARLLPDDPQAWEVAARLAAESPGISFGALAASAIALAR